MAGITNAEGGHVVENLVPCTPSANLDKKNRTAEEYLRGLASA